jgi:hypothetical protein
MITCPMCKMKLRGMEKECLRCKADVSLLVDYVDNLREGLVRAEAFTRAGQLGEAVWAYLEVLEIDPDNATARRQVGKVATAVRQFDETAPGRRWLTKLHKQNRFRRWLATWNEKGEAASWLAMAFWFVVIVGVLVLGYVAGMQHNMPPGQAGTAGQTQPADKARDKKEAPPAEDRKGDQPAAEPAGK